jgi:hypothetical protein
MSDNRWQLSPECLEGTLTKGYLTLPESFVSQNPNFSLQVGGFSPRFIQPHPYCNQDIVSVARGPIVYCLEDIDNLWASNHFKDVAIDTSSELRETTIREADDFFVAISAPGAGRLIDTSSWDVISQNTDEKEHGKAPNEIRKDLNFIPYYARANRGGSGQMRVGLRISRER